jgi:hypothetical protein
MAVQPAVLHSFIHYAVVELASKPRGGISQVSGKEVASAWEMNQRVID